MCAENRSTSSLIICLVSAIMDGYKLRITLISTNKYTCLRYVFVMKTEINSSKSIQISQTCGKINFWRRINSTISNNQLSECSKSKLIEFN